jgi:hypothetical protein
MINNKIASTGRVDELKGTIALDRHNAGHDVEEFLYRKMNKKQNGKLKSLDLEFSSLTSLVDGDIAVNVSFFDDGVLVNKVIKIKLVELINQFNEIKIEINF